MIRYHDISNNYAEFRTATVQKILTKDFIDLLKTRYLDNQSSIFESIGKTSPIKIYMDIEYVSNDQMLQRIIDKFQDFFKRYFRLPIGHYVVTKNNYISRKKLNSYHFVFTDYKLRLFDVRNLIGMFVVRHAEFNDYIDLQCYSVDNLFRSIGQYTIDHYNNVRSNNFENYHSLYNLHESRFYREDELTDELIEQSIVQGIDSCKELDAKIPIQSQPIINILIDYKKNKGCNGKPLVHVKREYDNIQTDLINIKNFIILLLLLILFMLVILINK
jgi:hypothetical protein